MGADAEARIWGVVGASGTGKGLWTKQQLRELKPRRLVVWDFKNEYGEFAGSKPAPTLRAVFVAMKKAGPDGDLRIRYVPRGAGEKAMRSEFEALCELVYAWECCLFIAEELANVTTPGWAPASWRKMTTSGRHAQIHIIGATQTPALVDKTFLGNCTLIHCCALRQHPHRVAVAQSMDIDPGRVAALVNFQWIEKDFIGGKETTGWVEVPGKKARSGSATTATGTGVAGAGQTQGGAAKVRLSSRQPMPPGGAKPPSRKAK